MTDPTATSGTPVSVPMEAILEGFRAALAEYAGAATARAIERAILAEATRDALLGERERAEANRKPATTEKD